MLKSNVGLHPTKTPTPLGIITQITYNQTKAQTEKSFMTKKSIVSSHMDIELDDLKFLSGKKEQLEKSC